MAKNTPTDPRPGFKRLSQIIGPNGRFPFGKSYWYAQIAAGEFPKPIKLGPRLAMWAEDELDALAERLISEGRLEAVPDAQGRQGVVDAITDKGTVSVNADNTLTFVPAPDSPGPAVIALKIGDIPTHQAA